MRADAEGLFVPASDLPDASVGDRIVVAGHDGGEERTGVIAATASRENEHYFRLEFDA